MINITRFEAGKSYYCRSVCDYDCIWSFTVARRTATSVWLVDDAGHDRGGRRAIKIWDGVESCMPLGSYSMAPVLKADRENVLEEA